MYQECWPIALLFACHYYRVDSSEIRWVHATVFGTFSLFIDSFFFQSGDTCTLCCVSRSERQLPEWQHKQTVCTVSWWLPQHWKYHILILCKNNTKPSFYWRFVLYLWLPVTFSPATAMGLSFAKSFLLVKLFLLLKTITVRIQNL